MSQGHDILVVDDDPSVIEILTESLEREGHAVRCAFNGREAIEAVAKRPPELVVLDVALPDISGYEVLEEFQKRDYVDVPVVFLTANTDVDARVRGFEAGAADYLVKPVSLRELNTRVRRALASSRQARTLLAKSHSLQTQLVRRRENQSRISRDYKRQILSMKTMFSVTQDLSRLVDPGDLVNMVSLTLLGELQVSSMAMFAVDREHDGRLTLLGVKGFKKDRIADIAIEREGRFVTMLSRDFKPRKIARNPDRRWTRLLPDLRLAVFEYVTPVVVRGDLKGLIFTGPKISADDYTDYDRDVLMFIANSAGVGLENARLFKQLQVTYVSTLKMMISIIEAKDQYTAGHTERVASFSNAIASRLGMSEDERRRVMFGALLHDIGKVGVMESVLQKDGTLDDNEWELLKQHPVVGARIVEKLEFLQGVAEIVRHHHESWNGRGYPDGLKGEDIPVGARIVTVADSFDAMTSDRSYRAALSTKEALERLEGGAGTQFDPWIVRVFVEHINERGKEPSVPDAEVESPV